MTGFLQDVRFALRQLRKSPGFATTAVLVLALGLGATTAMLAVVQSVLVRPLAYRDSDRLTLVGVSDQATQTSDVSYDDYLDMRRDLRQFEDLGAYSSMPLAVQTGDGAQMLVAPAVTTNFFDLLGVNPILGRTFRTGDDAVGAGCAVISHAFWQNSMHGRTDILGTKLTVNKHLYTVVGVMPPHFGFPLQTESLWLTLQVGPDHKTSQGFDTFSVMARLKPNVTLEQARSEGEAYLRNRKNAGAEQASRHFWLYPYHSLVTQNEKPALIALLAACFLLLAIAVVNTANLQIARATRREVEISMRAALGASRARILRQLVVESLLLSLIGAALGWALAMGLLKAAGHLFAVYARFDELSLDVWTFAGSLLLTTICGVAAGVAPAWHVLGKSRNVSLHQGSLGRVSRSHRLSRVLVTSEVALTCILLVAAGLFLHTFRSLQNLPMGFDPDHVTSFVLWPQSGDVSLPVAQASYQRVIDRLQSLPGTHAGVVTALPVSRFQIGLSGTFQIPGHPFPPNLHAPQVRLMAASSGYFESLHIPLIRGRLLANTDTHPSELVGVVNRAFAEQFMPGADPIGKQVVLEKDAEFPQPITIVGITGDVVQESGIGVPVDPEVLVPFQQLAGPSPLARFMVAIVGSFAVRSDRPSAETIAAIRDIVKAEAPEFAIDNLGPLNDEVDIALRTRRLSVELTSAFAWLALLLSAAGLYGVLAYLVGQRVREVGIRLALGATRENVFVLIAKQGAWMVGAGLLAGWTGALLASRWIRSFLWGTTTYDLSTYALAGGLIVLASAVAILFPARRAASIEPMEALRTE